MRVFVNYYLIGVFRIPHHFPDQIPRRYIMVFLFSIIATIVAFLVWRSASKKVQEHNMTFKGLAGLAAAGMVFFPLLAAFQCFTVVDAGNVGVVNVFGTVSDNTLKAGINTVNPFAQVIKFSVQTMEHKETRDIATLPGLRIQPPALCAGARRPLRRTRTRMCCAGVLCIISVSIRTVRRRLRTRRSASSKRGHR